MDEVDLTPEQRGLLKQIRARKAVVVAAHRRKKSAANNAPVKPRRADADRTSTTQQMKVCLPECPSFHCQPVDACCALHCCHASV